jgi:hypothetical protein
MHRGAQMPNKNYQRGRRLEWQVKKDLEQEGWHVMRTAGSHGAYDIVAIREKNGFTEIKFIQCKSGGKTINITKLSDELWEKSPINGAISAEGIHKAVYITVELIVKKHGESNYTVYPLES